MSAHPDGVLTTKALDQAYELRAKPKNLLFHLDQGFQYEVDYYVSVCGGIESNKVWADVEIAGILVPSTGYMTMAGGIKEH